MQPNISFLVNSFTMCSYFISIMNCTSGLWSCSCDACGTQLVVVSCHKTRHYSIVYVLSVFTHSKPALVFILQVNRSIFTISL